jgi:hypothetical protein
VVRSTHPFAFAASGPAAAWINADPLPLPPHIAESPVGRVHERDGQILLLGVGHEADTTLHLAEVLARVPYAIAKHVTVTPRRKGPSDRLRRKRPLLRALRARGCMAQGAGPTGRGPGRTCARPLEPVAPPCRYSTRAPCPRSAPVPPPAGDRLPRMRRCVGQRAPLAGDRLNCKPCSIFAQGGRAPRHCSLVEQGFHP